MVHTFVRKAIVVATLLAGSTSTAAQSKQDDLDRGKPAIQVRLNASRQSAPMGSTLGIQAEITNISTHDVFLNPLYMPLVIPTEIDPKGPRSWYPLVSPCDPDMQVSKTNKTGTERYNCVVRVSPGSHVLASWNVNKPALRGDPEDSWWNRRRIEFSFSPGIYKFPVVVNYWEEQDKAWNRDLGMARVETAELSLPLAVPISAIASGAFVGGMLAFVLGFAARTRPAPKSMGIKVWRVIRSGLLGVVVVVAIQRLAGASLPVTVTVNDFLGAICIGFIGAVSGESFLERILLKRQEEEKSKEKEPKETEVARKKSTEIAPTTPVENPED
jgi:hypothetical protein